MTATAKGEIAMADQVGVGVVGLGFVGAGAHLHSFRLLKQANLAAICDVNEKTVAKKAKRHDVAVTYTDHQKMLEDPNVDAVVVSVPTDHHARIAIDAMQAGWKKEQHRKKSQPQKRLETAV